MTILKNHIPHFIIEILFLQSVVNCQSYKGRSKRLLNRDDQSLINFHLNLVDDQRAPNALEDPFEYSTNADGSFDHILQKPTPSPTSPPTSAPSLVPTSFPISTPTPTATSTPIGTYPEAEIPLDPQSHGYYNYDADNPLFGPGHPTNVPYVVNSTFTYERTIYMDNGWLNVNNSPEYFYWTDALKEDADQLITNEVPSQCNSIYQSPINVMANGAICYEFHEIRSLPGDFKMNDHEFVEKQILPNKLRFKYWRRPPGVLEPDPPSIDLPFGWRNFADLLHIDIKVPSEHLIEGVRYPAEFQAWYYHAKRKRIIAVVIMMDFSEDDSPNLHWEKALIELELKNEADKMECRNSQRRKLRKHHEWLKEMENYVESGVQDTFISKLNQNEQTKLNGKNKISTILDEPKHIEDSFQKRRKLIRERSMISLFDGTQEIYKPAVNDNHEIEANREPPSASSNPTRWDPLHEEMKRSSYFYGYYGSLTEPPCSEIVSWRLIDTPTLISQDQYNRMREILFNHVDKNCKRTSSHHMSSVARPLQDPMGRPIWRCTSENYDPDP